MILIENQPAYKARLDMENGDEEAAFAAVVRPTQDNGTSNPREINKFSLEGFIKIAECGHVSNGIVPENLHPSN